MSSRRAVLRNKARGRAFQAKLAELSGGKNIGTLGNEDVMHEHFSYEAKTYDAKAKSHPRPWVGWNELTSLDAGEVKKFFVIAELSMTDDRREDLLLLRWYWWDHINNLKSFSSPIVSYGRVKRFIGNTE